MKKLLAAVLLLFCIACRQHSGNRKESPPDPVQKKQKTVIKPPTFYSDTIIINSKAAVFYYPDSSQLKTIEAGLDPPVYDAVMHEYQYQLKFAHNILRNWPGVKVVEARQARYLVFIKADKSRKIIDLDTKPDPYGLLVFDPRLDPAQMDMTNAGTLIGYYFADAGKPAAAK